MRRGISVLSAIILLSALVGVSPAQAAPALGGCDARSYSEALPPYTTHWAIGVRGIFVYWLHANPTSGSVTADYHICHPVGVPGPHALPIRGLAGQLPCTSPGPFAAVENGLIASYDLVGQEKAVAGSLIRIEYLYRFWEVKVQVRPGEWQSSDPFVARC
ncbi:hypothetical protein [Saccharothrix obliqua]|uniref:hypothetical protein n=1 Tax=Saccharothrix obliqua TaxID=2861747 RepID=UPI001C5E6273|nr:hypothetical protein [Saccharothrix obliqua]MBW4720524.1 hypothetical protein [Saccharothrix obliqua]